MEPLDLEVWQSSIQKPAKGPTRAHDRYNEAVEDNIIDGDEGIPPYDDKETYIPIFCTTDVPDEVTTAPTPGVPP